jgi:translocator protein
MALLVTIRSSWLLMGAFLLVILTYAVLATVWVSSEPGWYNSLKKPSFQPPDIVFGVIWPLNFLALGIVGALIARNEPTRAALSMLLVLTGSICFAITWAYLFYVPHLLLSAALCLLIAAVLNWALVFLAWRAHPGYGIGLVIYAGWLSVAAALAFSYSHQN